MAENEGSDFFEARAEFPRFDEAVEQFTSEAADILERTAAKAAALQDEASLANVRAMQAKLPAPAAVPQIQEATQAIERQNAARQQGVQLDLFDLDVLRQINQAHQEETVLRQRLQAEGILSAQPALPGLGRTLEPVLVTPSTQAAAAEAARLAAQLEQARLAEQALAAAAAEEVAQRARAAAEAARQLELDRQRLAAAVQERTALAYGAGQAAGRTGQRIPQRTMAALQGAPQGIVGWGAEQAALVRYNAALGENDVLQREVALSTEQMQVEMTRLGISENEASNALRRHGALTTEYLTALARGETTVSEFGYQIGATVAKFAGWTAAAAATYAVLGQIRELGAGAVASSSGVQNLTRTIDGLNHAQAATDLSNLAGQVNVPIAEAANAVFLFSRTFQNLDDAVAVARLGLRAYKLDNVDVADTVKAVTAIHQQFGLSAQQLGPVFDMLAAGQQKYNARISDMIPLLQRSASAVKNAGGDFNQFLAIATVAERTTQLSGSQLGTIFQRAASNFLNPNTLKGIANRAQLSQMVGANGERINAGPNVGFTQLVTEMIRFSATATNAQRAELAQAFSGSGLGGRAAGLFSGGGAPLLPRVQQTFDRSQGTLQTEMNKLLGTTSQQIKSFTVDLQRLGAAIQQSGALHPLGDAFHVLTGGIGALTGAASSFAGLSSPLRDVTMYAEAAGAALLFMSRTRFGNSIAELTRLNKLPGVGANDWRTATFNLRGGTRAAQETVSKQYEQTSSQLISTAAQRAALEQRRDVFIADAGGQAAIEQDEALLKRSNAMLQQIKVLRDRQIELEAQSIAQYETLEGLNEQQLMLRRSPRRGGYTPAERMDLAGQVAVGTNAEAALNADSQSVGVWTIARAKFNRSMGVQRARLVALAETVGITTEEVASTVTAEEAAAAEMSLSSAAMTTGAALARGAGTAALGLATGLRGFIVGLDPLLVGMIALPIVLGEISDASRKLSQATEAARQAASGPITSLDQLQSTAAEFQRAAQAQGSAHVSGGPLGILQNAVKGWGSLIGGRWGGELQDWATQRDPKAAERNALMATQLGALDRLYTASSRSFQTDANAMSSTSDGRAQALATMGTLEARMRSLLSGQGFNATRTSQLYGLYQSLLKQDFDNATAAAARRPGNSLSQEASFLASQSDQALQNQAQGYSDRSDIYGLSRPDFSSAVGAYFTMAARYRGGQASQAQLQALKTAQSAIEQAVSKNVTGYIDAAKTAGSERGATTDLSRATADVHTARETIAAWAEEQRHRWANLPGAIQAINNEERLLNEHLQTNVQNILQQALNDIRAQSALTTSQIGGISPEADLQRARSALAGLGQELRAAQAANDWQQVTELQTQINDQQRTIEQQMVSNAESIIQARGAVSEYAIQGLGPGADIARAQSVLSTARQLLAYDQGHGVGVAKVLQDQGQVEQDAFALKQQAQQRSQQVAQDAAAYISAVAALQQADTLDPVAQAREQLAADIKILQTIKPKDYKTYQEYQTALIDQQAKIATDTRNVQGQIVDTQTQTLQFQLHTQKITGQQYVAGLEQLLKLTKLTQQQRQQILTEIFDAEHQQAVNLNTASIRLPTTYEVRRAILGASRGRVPAAAGVVQQNNVNHTVNMTVNVSRDADLKKVTRALDGALKSNFNGAAQAMGLI